ncbi:MULTISPECIES: alkane 1-monooxygenase [Rhodococcus]|uniref:alkane 1-monooxygenase n=1 Tax=Rhodococcus TaxID=1827 RepID=UPI001E445C2C|nr:alkane 1-monooxygenase [Rhodococcus pyridinivorans]MCD2116100.1 alkane 1-monooxygenase [Rhodococcus pyridinivorans]MCZ4624967.1 alkane 1-monooxygenase [Rhodococcus pyridinivorans]MCZ4646514.1 alkane 1-monooxygenase [Rhodococcus pyridinivorans]MDJ0484279.1 alkane 1-monooxygenase [Rhodococcus pyridinivorans]MDV7252279.1 alkane 1-monooxygenase [Rhodococcus pyridinivorans]
MDSATPRSATHDRWTDPKKHLWLYGLVVPLSPFIAYFLVEYLHLGVFWATGALVIAVVCPLVDAFARLDTSNPPESAMRTLENDRYYRYCTYLYLPLQYAGLTFGCWMWVSQPMGGAERFAMAATLGIVGGVGINAAHELGHKRTTIERRLAKIALAQSFYGHFYVEHNRGHHARVATPEDPATARMGESYWRFLPRSVFGSLRSAIRYEKGRLERRGTSFWNLRHNDILNAWALSVVLYAVLIAVFGWSIAPWLVVQAVMAIMFLEGANYLEHYGLLREKRPDGSYERVQPQHSWNSNHVCSNLFLYNLQRHSDHHANPLRRYQTLRSMPQAPQLPAGYAVLIILALFPPLWRRIMDPRLLEHYSHDFSRINIDPSTRKSVLARYARAQRGSQ